MSMGSTTLSARQPAPAARRRARAAWRWLRAFAAVLHDVAGAALDELAGAGRRMALTRVAVLQREKPSMSECRAASSGPAASQRNRRLKAGR